MKKEPRSVHACSELDKEQAYRDPVHDFILIREPLFKRLVDTREFQRLRRIRQLGFAFGTYHGAEHSRFGHSLGVFSIMTSVIERLRTVGVVIDDETSIVARSAALLHDIGHGPFSHALEGYITPDRDHEYWTIQLLLGSTEVNAVLKDEHPELPHKVASMINGTYTGPAFMRDLVSSQLDVDRMDYLLRDSYYAGVTYGRFDLDRIVQTLQVLDDQLVSQSKGIVALEEYLLARYLMYWQVYLHKTIRSHEALLKSMWLRARAVAHSDPAALTDDVSKALMKFLCPPHNEGGRGDTTSPYTMPDVELTGAYLDVDDSDVLMSAKAWRQSRDTVLSDLAGRLMDRRLLKSVFRRLPPGVQEDRIALARRVVNGAGYDPDYYLIVDDVKRSAYDPYQPESAHGRGQRPVWVLDERQVQKEISTVSPTVKSLASHESRAVNIFAPDDVIERVRDIFSD